MTESRLWEYRVLTVGGGAAYDDRTQEMLNELGANGWELVAAAGFTLFLKRKVKFDGG
ncbi:DUF4177 domain-containing protein [Mesorhizobium sp. WSM3864]|uniref:DUF4177 domain-containing protein n=1 Tax=Mesorhizobium sp. WSM3864 TaxID=2029404 RepID=UPI0011410AC3|nr:DUF4177 domain-containing protein [Mesorhizobium sp. WSM3864]